MTTHTLETAGAAIAYDVRGPLPTANGRPPLFMIGQPMAADGFATLASHFPDRTVVTYDPRGLGRSARTDDRVDHSPTVQAGDVHAVIEALGAGPVEMFASSGGAVTALALVAAHPGDVTTLVAHEPPLIPVLPDAAAAERARAGVREPTTPRGGVRAWRPSSRCPRGAASTPTTTSPRPRPTPPPSGCRPATTARARTRCCRTAPGR
jgi:pimeloyl-ACP methyl ester carboxylesterase